MTADKNDTILRKLLSWQTILSLLFSIILVFGSGGIGLRNLPSQRQEVYAQEDSDFGAFPDESVPIQGETDTFPDESVPPETVTTAQGEICDNFFDDDGDGFVDSDDPEGCTPVGGGQSNFEICDDLIDDDGDGFVDSDDPEGCTPVDKCDLVREMRAQDCPVEEGQPIFEICNNFFDDDGDGFVDEDCPIPIPSDTTTPTFPPENVNGSTTFPPENVNGSTTFPPENVNGSTTFPPENVNGSTTFPPENVNGSTTFPPENVNGSTTFPPENVNGSTTFPPENVNGSTTFPPENVNGSTTFPPVEPFCNPENALSGAQLAFEPSSSKCNVPPLVQVCIDGSLPDTFGLCPDGSSPQPAQTPVSRQISPYLALTDPGDLRVKRLRRYVQSSLQWILKIHLILFVLQLVTRPLSLPAVLNREMSHWLRTLPIPVTVNVDIPIGKPTGSISLEVSATGQVTGSHIARPLHLHAEFVLRLLVAYLLFQCLLAHNFSTLSKDMKAITIARILKLIVMPPELKIVT